MYPREWECWDRHINDYIHSHIYDSSKKFKESNMVWFCFYNNYSAWATQESCLIFGHNTSNNAPLLQGRLHFFFLLYLYCPLWQLPTPAELCLPCCIPFYSKKACSLFHPVYCPSLYCIVTAIIFSSRFQIEYLLYFHIIICLDSRI